jgi:hypothetical protein
VRRYFQILANLLLLSIILGFAGGIIFSRLYWGYYIDPPIPLVQAVNVGSISSFGIVSTKIPKNEPNLQLRLNEGKTQSFIAATGKTPGWETRFPERISSLQDLFVDYGSGVRLSINTPLPSEALAGAMLDFLKSKEAEIEKGQEGYERQAETLGGTLMVFDDAHSHERRLSAKLRSGQIGNDHYGFYEYLFAVDENGLPGKLLRKQIYFYDDAGIENLYWVVMALILNILFFAPLFVITATGLALKRWRQKRRDGPISRIAT